MAASSRSKARSEGARRYAPVSPPRASSASPISPQRCPPNPPGYTPSGIRRSVERLGALTATSRLRRHDPATPRVSFPRHDVWLNPDSPSRHPRVPVPALKNLCHLGVACDDATALGLADRRLAVAPQAQLLG